MAYTKTTLSQLPGKTIESYELWFENQELMIAFTDQTFIIVGCENDLAHEPVLFSVNLSLHRHGDLAVAAGLFTAQEKQAAIAAKQEALEQQLEAREYETYLRLKAKYEP